MLTSQIVSHNKYLYWTYVWNRQDCNELRCESPKFQSEIQHKMQGQNKLSKYKKCFHDYFKWKKIYVPGHLKVIVGDQTNGIFLRKVGGQLQPRFLILWVHIVSTFALDMLLCTNLSLMWVPKINKIQISSQLNI